MKYWIFSVLTALLAYGAGCLKSTVLASNFIFHKNLRRLGRGNVFLSNFRRIYGWKGALKLGLVELVLDLLPILFGAVLFRSGDHSVVGASLAGFCLVLGRLYPASYEFRGSHALAPLILAGFAVETSIGIAMLIVAAALVWLSRYFSLAAIGCALVLIITDLLMVDDPLTVRLGIMTAALVLVYHIPAMLRMVKGTETRLSFEQDISYKFDEKF